MDLKDSMEVEKLKQSFKTFYLKSIRPVVDKIEKERKAKISIVVTSWSLAIIFLFFLILTLLFAPEYLSGKAGDPNNKDIFFILTIVFLIVPCVVTYCLQESYKKSIKQRLMASLVTIFGNFQYIQGETLSDQVIRASKIIQDNFNIHRGDDYFKGKYKDVNITISEELIQREYSVATRDGTERHVEHIFKGVFTLIEMNKPIKTRTIVLPNRSSLFGKNRFEKIELEDPEFEKIWDTYGEDQIEARYVLTTAFMERLKKLTKTFDTKSISCSFFGNNLLIAVPKGEDMFEVASLFTPITDLERVEATFKQIVAFLGIIDQLKMDQKIGM